MRLILLAIAMTTATLAGAQTAPAPDGVAPAAATATIRIVPATPVAAETSKYKTELICKSTLETGSLIAKRKMCLTRRQWAYVDDQNANFVHRLQEDNAGKSSGFGGGPN